MLRSHAGAARFAWNWGLAKCQARYTAEAKWYSGFDLHKLWNIEKKTDPALAWWNQNSKCAYQEAFRDLDRALGDYIKSKNGQRKGKRLGFPRFKKRGKCKDAFRLYGVIRCAGNTVTLPRIGTVNTHESTRKLARRLVNGTARILSATITRTAQRWYVSFTVEVQRAIPAAHPRPGSHIGIDLGITTLLTGADHTGRVIQIPGPQPLRGSLRKLRRASRAHSRTQPGSANRAKSAARLARLHAHVTNIRTDALHKHTTSLSARYETIAVEDLNVAGMTRNRKLARAISDQSFGAAVRMLGYKTSWNGGRLIKADRWYPSSKTCSACGAVKAKLTLAERVFACEVCGHAEDRDVNAARNLLKLAASGAESLNASGSPGKTRPRAGHRAMNQEPGTTLVDKTGTAARQQAAADQEPLHAR